MAKYTYFDHGSWAYTGGVYRRVSDGADWNAYRSTAANWHGGPILSMITQISTPGYGQVTNYYANQSSIPGLTAQLIELLDYAGTNLSADFAGTYVGLADGFAEVVKPYNVGPNTVLARCTDVELQTLYGYQEARPLREKMMQSVAWLVTGNSLSSPVAAYKALLTSLFGATRADQLLAP
jgi:hypothetical protein